MTMIRKLIILYLLASTAGQISAQEVTVSAGYAAFNMGELSELNDEFLFLTQSQQYKLVNDFPGFVYLEASVKIPIGDFMVGPYGSLTSTGSRIAYNDYSGHQYLDQVLVGWSVGGVGSCSIHNRDRNELRLNLRAGATFTFHKIKSEEVIYNYSGSAEEVEFKNMNLSVEPGLIYLRSLGSANRYCLTIEAGYNVNFLKDKLYLKDDSNLYLTNSAGHAVHPDWSGIRLSAGLTYKFRL